jgi:hypothetical protein
MPRTKPTTTITHAEWEADPGKWVGESGKGVVVVLDQEGEIAMTLGTGYYPHTRRMKHQFEAHRDDPQMLSELRDYYCRLNKRGHIGTIHALIEFIEAYAESEGWNLDDYSDWKEDEQTR